MVKMVAILLFFYCMNASSTVALGGTRIIYPAHESEVSLKISNTSPQASLVQVWFDSGNPRSTPDTGQAPFIASPPLFRIDPSNAQVVRIMYLDEPLPQDRESVFWLNVLDVPPMTLAQGAANGILDMAFRSRIKLFYRPVGLRQNVEDAALQLRWEWQGRQPSEAAAIHARSDSAAITNNDGIIRVVNDSPFHLSLSAVRLHKLDGLSDDADIALVPVMLKPKSWHDFYAESRSDPILMNYENHKRHEIIFDVINDYGGVETYRVGLESR